jgi:hypothetical protein
MTPYDGITAPFIGAIIVAIGANSSRAASPSLSISGILPESFTDLLLE